MPKKIKTIEIKLNNDLVYSVKAQKIAHDRAEHYKDDYEDQQWGYKNVYHETINDEHLLREWLLNEMNWYDLEPVLARDEREMRLPRLIIESLTFNLEAEEEE